MSAPAGKRLINAVVVSAGLMQKTVKCRIGHQEWHNKLHKFYNVPRHVLVHDPNNSLRAGDVVSITSGWRTSKQVRHVVDSIIAPFGTQIVERPPIPTEAERLAVKAAKKAAKDERRSQRRNPEAAAGATEATA